MWDEGKICPRRIASAPPSCRLRLGGHPKSAGTPSPSPAAAAPTCLWGRGRRGGPDVTGGLSQSELPFPSPKGIPGPQQGPGARPSSDDPQPGLKRGPAPGRGHRGWNPAEGGGGAGVPLPRPAPAGPERGSRGGSHTAGSEAGARAGGAQAAGQAFLSPLAPGTRAGLSLCPARGLRAPPGLSRPLRPGAAARPCWARGVSAAGARKTRTGFLPGRIWTGAQCCPTGSSDGETEAQRGGTSLKVTN